MRQVSGGRAALVFYFLLRFRLVVPAFVGVFFGFLSGPAPRKTELTFEAGTKPRAQPGAAARGFWIYLPVVCYHFLTLSVRFPVVRRCVGVGWCRVAAGW